MSWISVDERLPDDGSEVLIYIGKQRLVAEKCKLFGFLDSLGREALLPDIPTHWQPLPEPPEN